MAVLNFDWDDVSFDDLIVSRYRVCPIQKLLPVVMDENQLFPIEGLSESHFNLDHNPRCTVGMQGLYRIILLEFNKLRL